VRFAAVRAVVAALLLCVPVAPASADPFQASLTLSINPLIGSHEVGNGQQDRVDFAPLPLGELDLRYHRESLHAEGLPSVTFGYTSNADGARSTRLSLLNLAYRHAIGDGWFVGIGQTVYNQRTDYGFEVGNRYYAAALDQTTYIDGSEVQDSRLTGMRFEVGRTYVRGRDRIEIVIAGNPVMHGVQYTQIGYGLVCTPGGCNFGAPTFADPETAAQTDLSVRVGHRLSRHADLLLGLRYLNYSAHYVAPGNPLSDRNVGFAPVIAYRLHL
jgi:hypothetical protein